MALNWTLYQYTHLDFGRNTFIFIIVIVNVGSLNAYFPILSHSLLLLPSMALLLLVWLSVHTLDFPSGWQHVVHLQNYFLNSIHWNNSNLHYCGYYIINFNCVSILFRGLFLMKIIETDSFYPSVGHLKKFWRMLYLIKTK